MDTENRIREMKAVTELIARAYAIVVASAQSSFEIDQARVKLREADHWLTAHVGGVRRRAAADAAQAQEKLPLPEREAAGEPRETASESVEALSPANENAPEQPPAGGDREVVEV